MEVTKSQISQVMAALGKIKSARKAAASRENGKLGGCPKGPRKLKPAKSKTYKHKK